MEKSIVELLKDNLYREKLIESLIFNIPDNLVVAFKEVINYVVDEKFHLFQIEDFENSFYYNDDNTIELVLPAVRRVFAKVFINPPSLFKSDTESLRYQLFILYFNIDEFLDYLVDMMLKCKNSLEHFEHIDRTAETLTLIVDNFIASLVKKVRSCDDIEVEIKNQKTILNRESSLNQILHND